MSGARRPRVAMVVQRAGREVNGGAEALCRDVALALRSVWDVTIVTTTAIDYGTWAPDYPAGPGDIEGLPVLRFDVDEPRSPRHFDTLSARLLAKIGTAPLAEQEAWMRAQGPYSTRLLRYLEDHGDSYDLVIFYTYLYATTYFGMPLVRDRAVLVPFAHDEWPIHLSMWNERFAAAREVVLSTSEERDFLEARFGRPFAGPVIGIGVDLPEDADGSRFRQRCGVANPFAIYVGRIEAAKGCEQLLQDFAQHKRRVADDLILVMLGRAQMALPTLPYLRPLGFVDEQTKFDGLAASEFLIMPSALESLSISLLEAWSVSRPVLVNAASDVLVGQSRRANAGLWYGDAAELSAGIDLLRGPAGRELGANGRRFVAERYAWPRIIEAYQHLYERFAVPVSSPA
uniref:Alpha-D-kanosaminyltransferase n=1 Tax=uncultured organism TaxID=155900 RepID=A0A7L9QCC8_9ZZZZ|nr:alpha-D-kanosaminyltransferase [uncultured organism]